MVASSTLLSMSIQRISSGEVSSPMAMSRQSRPANRGLVCLLPEGGWFMRSWTAACVNDGCRCRGDGGMLRRFSAKLWRCAALFILDEEGERCGGGDWWEPADEALGTFIACPRAVTSASPASLGSALEDASILASGQHGVAAAIAGSCLSRIQAERGVGEFSTTVLKLCWQPCGSICVDRPWRSGDGRGERSWTMAARTPPEEPATSRWDSAQLRV